MRSIAAALPVDDPARAALESSAARHAKAALEHVASGDYAGEHWLASFAVYLLSKPLIMTGTASCDGGNEPCSCSERGANALHRFSFSSLVSDGLTPLHSTP